MTSDPTVQQMSQQLLTHAAAIAELRAMVLQLTEETTETPETPGRSPIVTSWCWRNATPRATEDLWHELITWTDWIRHRYPLARRIPACWHKHPEIVEELTALWLAWHHAYEEAEAPLTAAVDWHDRWLPGVLHRLEHGPFALDCDNEHHDRPAGAYAPLPAKEEAKPAEEAQEEP